MICTSLAAAHCVPASPAKWSSVRACECVCLIRNVPIALEISGSRRSAGVVAGGRHQCRRKELSAQFQDEPEDESLRAALWPGAEAVLGVWVINFNTWMLCS